MIYRLRSGIKTKPSSHLLIEILICLLFTFSYSLKAQQIEDNTLGRITGTVIDSITSQPVEYATISLINKVNNKVINGTTTDSKGKFNLIEIPEASYKMQIYFIGYETKMLNNIVVSNLSPDLNLGHISLSSANTTLQAVTITAEKNIIENKIDKMVYNAEKDISSQSGVATDVLKKIPQVSVDVDGNVELQGNSGIRFLINGKPSTIFGSNIADVLQSIPAGQIQSIEVITSPGAKYDAEGVAGIINIILKKTTTEGFNGNVSFSVGTRLENGAINLNAHHKHFSVNAFFSGNAQLTSLTKNSLKRSAVDTATLQKSQLLQNGTGNFSRNGFETGLGFDWDVSPHNNFSGSLGYDYFENRNSGIVNHQSILNDQSGNLVSQVYDLINTTNKFNEHAMDFEIAYKKTFKKEDQELEMSINSSFGKNNNFYQQTQQLISIDSIIQASYGNDPGIENETEIALNYTHPVAEDFVLETGAKTTLTNIKSNANVYLRNPETSIYNYEPSLSSVLDYKTNVYALYLSSSFNILDWFDIKAGFRYEYTGVDASFSNVDTINIKPYNTYVPSLIIAHKFKENQMIKISYTHRIERPEYRDLNPFLNASDPKNITTGNTGLKPEVGEKLEFEYSKNFKNGTTSNLIFFYRGNKDDIQSYTYYYPEFKIGDSVYYNVALSKRENVGREDNYGFNFFISIPASSRITLRSNISAFERYIINGLLPGNNIHGFNYRINLNAAYHLSNSISVELFGNFNSPRINTQGKFPSFTTYNFAVRKQFLNKKGSIAFTATNLFNKYVTQKTELTGSNFISENIRELPYQSFGINFTYKFGKLEFKNEKELEDINLTNPPGQ
ncbi:MAG TPA: outer membrane beta-barrel protein [Saprospiraceae bacterium]|nr:outer membrane beta-barrel protein [Saprospiraceae bacterium]